MGEVKGVDGGGGVAFAYYQADSNWNPIIIPGQAAEYGRVLLAGAANNLYVPIQGGIPLKAIFKPTQARVTINGTSYSSVTP